MSLRFHNLRFPLGGAERRCALALLIAIAALPLVGCTGEVEGRAALAADPAAGPAAAVAPTTSTEPAGRLRLVDIGADRCIPCRAMAPILEELRVEHAQRLDVVFVDVWKNPDAGRPYAVAIIPTQVFYDASGRELWRHQGFLSKRDILANWKRLGYDLEAPTSPERGENG